MALHVSLYVFNIYRVYDPITVLMLIPTFGLQIVLGFRKYVDVLESTGIRKNKQIYSSVQA